MKNLFVVSANGDPLSDMLLSGDTIQEAAKSPQTIGRLLVDMAYSEGHDLEKHCLYFEKSDKASCYLEKFRTGFEELITGGWIRVITPPNVYAKEKAEIQLMLEAGVVVNRGIYRGCQLIEFVGNAPQAQKPASKAKGFA